MFNLIWFNWLDPGPPDPWTPHHGPQGKVSLIPESQRAQAKYCKTKLQSFHDKLVWIWPQSWLLGVDTDKFQWNLVLFFGVSPQHTRTWAHWIKILGVNSGVSRALIFRDEEITVYCFLHLRKTQKESIELNGRIVEWTCLGNELSCAFLSLRCFVSCNARFHPIL